MHIRSIDRLINQFINLPVPILHHWGYWIIFFAALAESTPILGIIIPGQTFVILGGFFARTGAYNVFIAALLAAVGGFIGDMVGYFTGKRIGHPFIIKYGKYIKYEKQHYEKTKSLLEKHAGKTILIGRLNGVTRALIPFISGTMRIPLLRFIPYTILSCLLWASTFIGIGFIFGQSYELIQHHLGRIVILAFLLSIGLGYAYYFVNKKKHIFQRFHLHILIINIVSLFAFAKIFQDITRGSQITKLDLWVSSNITSLWDNGVIKIMKLITSIGGSPTIIILTISLFVIYLFRKKWFSASVLLVSSLGGFFTEYLIKIAVHRARPEGALLTLKDYSFPSGHSVITTVFFLSIIFAFRRSIKNIILKNIFISANVIAILTVGFSRIYLNVHWITDVLAGFSLGLFWVTFTMLLGKYIMASKNKHLT